MHAQLLQNGFIRVDHRASGLVFLFHNWNEITDGQASWQPGRRDAADAAAELASAIRRTA